MSRNLSLVLALGLLASCGAGEDAGADGTGDAGSGSGDAGGNIGCDLTIVPPAEAAVGQPIEVSVNVSGGAFGARDFTWSVDLGGVTQSIAELADPVDRIAFTPAVAGPYRVVVDATIGGDECLPATTTIGVIASGARTASYRMRVVPADGAPAQDIPVVIYGGSDAVLPTTVLTPGVLASGQILDSNGAGVPAYVRARLRDAISQTDFEAFASATGAYSLRLPEGRYDILVVPEGGALPAALFLDRSIAELGVPLNLAAPTAIVGRLLDAAGAGVAGARISLLVDGARSTEATSESDGRFSVLATGSTLTGLAVAPAPGSGMPSLRAEALSGQAVSDASNVLIRYADTSIAAQVDITDSAGASAGGALVEWRADLPAAATVNVGSAESVAGTLRVAATADAAGRVQSSLVARASSIVVQASGGAEASLVRDVPWNSSPLTSLSLEALVAVPFEVGQGGSPLEGAEVQATPVGILAPQIGVVTAATAVNGTGAVGLVRGGDYQLLVSHSGGGESTAEASDAQSSTVLPAFDMPGSIVAQGQVHIDTQVAAGAQVRLFCDDCTGLDATRVHASAVADETGRFMFRISDPGVDAQ